MGLERVEKVRKVREMEKVRKVRRRKAPRGRPQHQKGPFAEQRFKPMISQSFP
jgi:hypothetical protein